MHKASLQNSRQWYIVATFLLLLLTLSNLAFDHANCLNSYKLSPHDQTSCIPFIRLLAYLEWLNSLEWPVFLQKWKEKEIFLSYYHLHFLQYFSSPFFSLSPAGFLPSLLTCSFTLCLAWSAPSVVSCLVDLLCSCACKAFKSFEQVHWERSFES